MLRDMGDVVLYNISKVEFIEARYLRGVVALGGGLVWLGCWRNFSKLCVAGLGEMAVSEAVVHGSRVRTVKLTVRVRDGLEGVGVRRLAWRVTCVDGRQWLLGGVERPWPVALVGTDFPGAVTERGGVSVAVTWSSAVGPLRIVD
jgi:hypothetical protein